jgi:uncharacterized protein (TIGR02300 family)
VAKPELGSKRQCLSCASKFYDLNKAPIICPKCGAVFQVMAVKARPEPVAAPRAVAPEPEPAEVEPVVADAEVVSLEDVEAAENAKDLPGDDDVEIEETEADDTFLEPEEESEDDVSGLIDKGEDDEET